MWTKFGDDMSKRSWVMLDKTDRLTDRQTDRQTNRQTNILAKNCKFWQVTKDKNATRTEIWLISFFDNCLIFFSLQTTALGPEGICVHGYWSNNGRRSVRSAGTMAQMRCKLSIGALMEMFHVPRTTHWLAARVSEEQQYGGWKSHILSNIVVIAIVSVNFSFLHKWNWVISYELFSSPDL